MAHQEEEAHDVQALLTTAVWAVELQPLRHLMLLGNMLSRQKQNVAPTAKWCWNCSREGTVLACCRLLLSLPPSCASPPLRPGAGLPSSPGRWDYKAVPSWQIVSLAGLLGGRTGLAGRHGLRVLRARSWREARAARLFRDLIGIHVCRRCSPGKLSRTGHMASSCTFFDLGCISPLLETSA